MEEWGGEPEMSIKEEIKKLHKIRQVIIQIIKIKREHKEERKKDEEKEPKIMKRSSAKQEKRKNGGWISRMSDQQELAKEMEKYEKKFRLSNILINHKS